MESLHEEALISPRGLTNDMERLGDALKVSNQTAVAFGIVREAEGFVPLQRTQF